MSLHLQKVRNLVSGSNKSDKIFPDSLWNSVSDNLFEMWAFEK